MPTIQIHAQKTQSGWLWCLHCERAYRHGEYRLIKGLQMCPYDDCNGDTVMDGWSWDDHKPDIDHWPDMPKKNVHYPLYN